jgi:hypothetical protein
MMLGRPGFKKTRSSSELTGPISFLAAPMSKTSLAAALSGDLKAYSESAMRVRQPHNNRVPRGLAKAH